jgi:hypothetical protein
MISSSDGRAFAILLCMFASLGLALRGSPPDAPLLLLGALNALVISLRPGWIPGLLALDLALIAWQSAAAAPTFFSYQYDTWVHLALVRRVLENGPFPPHPYYVEHGAAPLTSLVHHVYATAALVSRRPIAELWRWGSPLAVAALGAAAYFAHRELFRERTAAFFAALFYLVWRYHTWGHATYPRCLAPALYFLSLGVLWRALRSGGSVDSLGAGALLGLTFGVHPVTGSMGALVVAAVLAIEGARRKLAGEGRAVALLALRVGLGAAVAASPWLVSDALAWFARVQGHPGGTAPPRDMLDFTIRTLKDDSPFAGWAYLAGGALLLGTLRLFGRTRDRLVPIYVAATALVVAVAIVSPASDFLRDGFGPRYVARFAYFFPLPALAGLGVSLATAGRGRVRSLAFAAGVIAVALYTAVLFRGVEPWKLPLAPDPLPQTVRPELASLESVVRDRVVVTDRHTAYALPYFTGAFVAWNGFRRHANRWVYDAQRKAGASKILGGRMSGSELQRYCDRYAVDFALLPSSLAGPIKVLLLTKQFRSRLVGEGFVLLERTPRE